MDKLSQMGISMDEIRSRVTERDFEKLINVLGPDGVIIAQRLRSLLR
jgi:hypothetical protein